MKERGREGKRSKEARSANADIAEIEMRKHEKSYLDEGIEGDNATIRKVSVNNVQQCQRMNTAQSV